MNKKTKEELSKTIVKNNYDKSISKLIKKIERNQKDCKYMSGQLCKCLKEVKEDFITLQTPFDIVYIKLKKDKKSKVEETEVGETEVNAGAWKRYVNLSTKIEELIPDKDERIAGLEKIYYYLNILKDENITSIEQFNSKVKKEFNVKNTNKYDENGKNIRKKGKEKEENERKKNLSLAYLSAILMISEPFRFNDGGGLSRGAIRYIYINLKSKNIDKAISKALGGKIDNDKLLFSTEDGKKSVYNIIEKAKKQINSKKNEYNDVYDDNMKNMKMECVSDDEDYKDEKYKNKAKISDIDIKIAKEIIRKAYQDGEIHIFSAIGKMNKLKNQSDKKSKFIGKKRFISKSKKQSTSLPKNKLKKIK